MNQIASHIKTFQNAEHNARSIYMADAFEELFHSKAKHSLITANPLQVFEQMHGTLQRANHLNVDLTADPTQLPAYQEKVLLMDEMETEWFIKNKTVEEFWIFSEEGISIRFRINSINESKSGA